MSKEFWIGQGFAILGTVIGVYLAAMAGFRLAIDFENMKSRKDTYYIAAALYNEAKDNADNMLKWGTTFQSYEGAGFEMKEKEKDYILHLFVWNTMKESSGTFELPFQYLGEIQSYYAFSEAQMRKMMESPMSMSLGKPLVDESQNILKLLEKFKNYVDKEKEFLTSKGFEL